LSSACTSALKSGLPPPPHVNLIDARGTHWEGANSIATKNWLPPKGPVYNYAFWLQWECPTWIAVKLEPPPSPQVNCNDARGAAFPRINFNLWKHDWGHLSDRPPLQPNQVDVLPLFEVLLVILGTCYFSALLFSVLRNLVAWKRRREISVCRMPYMEVSSGLLEQRQEIVTVWRTKFPTQDNVNVKRTELGGSIDRGGLAWLPTGLRRRRSKRS